MSIAEPRFQVFKPSQFSVIGTTSDNLGWEPLKFDKAQLVVGKVDVGDNKDHLLTLPLTIYTPDPNQPDQFVKSPIQRTEQKRYSSYVKPLPTLGTLSYQA
jgi:hypothetical protein